MYQPQRVIAKLHRHPEPDSGVYKFTTIVWGYVQDSYGEICKYFGIDKVEESIRHRQEKNC